MKYLLMIASIFLIDCAPTSTETKVSSSQCDALAETELALMSKKDSLDWLECQKKGY